MRTIGVTEYSFCQIEGLLTRRNLSATVNVFFEGSLHPADFLKKVKPGETFSLVIEGENEEIVMDMLFGRLHAGPQVTCERETEIRNKLGLHDRASVKIIKLAQLFNADVFLERRERDNVVCRINALSFFRLIMLAAGPGTTLTVSAYGPEACEAVEAVCSLISNRFGEDD